MEYSPAIPVPDVDGINVLSLGAGVQSSALALMAASGDFGAVPDIAIFADTQDEPPSVYQWLDWLQAQLPFPVVKVTAGRLSDGSTEVRTAKSGNKYARNNIPAFMSRSDSVVGILGRQCTANYKIDPIYREMKQRYKGAHIIMWMGISWDETQRMRDPRRPWVTHRYPLIERRITRQQCIDWMAENGYPTPPRSACVFCPYHSNKEWSRLKTEEPEEFSKAVRYEKRLQNTYDQVSRVEGVPFLHRSCAPLETVDFADPSANGQGDLFLGECEGMCGI